MIERMVRVGRVTARDPARKKVRVLFLETEGGTPSGWLYCVQRPQTVTITPEGDQTAALSAWVPRINALCLCIFSPVADGDGYAIGEISGGDG